MMAALLVITQMMIMRMTLKKLILTGVKKAYITNVSFCFICNE